MEKLVLLLIGGNYDAHAGKIKNYTPIEIEPNLYILTKSNIICDSTSWTSPYDDLKYGYKKDKFNQELNDYNKIFLIKDEEGFKYLDKFGEHLFDEDTQLIVDRNLKIFMMENVIY